MSLQELNLTEEQLKAAGTEAGEKVKKLLDRAAIASDAVLKPYGLKIKIAYVLEQLED